MTALRLALPLLATLAACGAADPEPPPERFPGCPGGGMSVDPAGTTSTWVVDSVHVPTTATETNRLGLNLDCDAQNRPDNALANSISLIQSSESSDLNAELAAMIGEARLLHLNSIQATSTTDAVGVGVILRHGLDTDGDPGDNFDGDEAFAIDTGRGRGQATGYVMDGRLSVRGAQLPVGVTLPSLDEVVILPLEGARIEAVVADGLLEGRIAGGIPEEAVDAILIPFIHRGLLRAIERDCTGLANGHRCGCAANSFGRTLIDYFDELPDRPEPEADGDCVLGVDEFRGHWIVRSFLAPDVDLFDEDGELNPRADGVKDSLSVGVGFTAVPARLQ